VTTPHDQSAFAAYEALWQRIRDGGVWVHYDGVALDEGGHFQHDGCGKLKKPEIQITRSHYNERERPTEFLNTGEPAPIVNELMTLAHEYGHYLSWSREPASKTWKAYHAAVVRRDKLAANGRDAVSKGLSRREMQLICDEETLAWKLGREFIPDGLHTDYDEHSRLGVHYHRYRLGLDELWPEDK